jgi:hypothetical protein
MRSLAIILLMTSHAHAGLPPREETVVMRAPLLEELPAPCLRPTEEMSYVVTWWIENKETGERRDVSSQEVRLTC